jgi:hypothetical protein
MNNRGRMAPFPHFRLCLAAFLLAWTGPGCHLIRTASPKDANLTLSAPPSSAPIHFTEIAEKAGIPFQHHNGARGKKYMPETVGSGVAFLDYDDDGWQDILIVNSTDWPENHTAASRRNTPHLYHNNRDGTFTDVTHAAGLDVEMYGMGAAVGDFDNDGYEDIYLTGIGPNHLFHNTLGNRSVSPTPYTPHPAPYFEDVTAKAGVAGVPYPGTELKWKWSASAAWLDYDRDGRLDLFVCQYVQWSPATDHWCGHYGVRGYCPPGTYEPSYCTLYHNEGSGHFRDVSAETGIRSPRTRGKSFGVAVTDFNGDGWPDIAVSNDTWANFLFLNERGKRFSERAVESGIALGENGKARAGMGIDAADWLNNGHFGLLIGNFSGESLSLYRNDGPMLFTDQAHPSGLAAPSLLSLTFGLFFFDCDLDGWQDAFTANGHIDDVVNTYSEYTFRQRPQLFRNLGDGRFQERGAACGFTEKMVARGAAFADIDNDGYPDVAVVDNGGRFRLYHNEGESHHCWIRFRLEGVTSNREGLGALVRVTAGGITQSRYVHSGGGFLSESQRQPTFGLGASGAIARVEVTWPGGTIDRSGPLTTNRQYLITEGKGFQPDPRTQQTEVTRR